MKLFSPECYDAFNHKKKIDWLREGHLVVGEMLMIPNNPNFLTDFWNVWIFSAFSFILSLEPLYPKRSVECQVGGVMLLFTGLNLGVQRIMEH